MRQRWSPTRIADAATQRRVVDTMWPTRRRKCPCGAVAALWAAAVCPMELVPRCLRCWEDTTAVPTVWGVRWWCQTDDRVEFVPGPAAGVRLLQPT